MCNVLLRDPNNRLWQLSVQDDGTLQTALTALNLSDTSDPVLQNGMADAVNLKLTADIDGKIITSPASGNSFIRAYVGLIAPHGNVYKLALDSNNLLFTSLAPLGTETNSIPRPQDVTMSQWPDSIGVTCPTCGATVTVNGDMSCWCCVCSSFVNPEDTTILVVLDE